MRTSSLLALAALSLANLAHGQDAVSPEAFAKACAEKAESPTFSVAGADPEWLFLTQELKHLATGTYWEKDAAEVTASGEHATRFFVDLNEKLTALGVELIVVPVPPKGAIYPDKLVEGATLESVPAAAPSYVPLTEAGITVIDIEPELRAARADAAAPSSFCKTDAHPSPQTIEQIAARIAAVLKSNDWATAAAEASSLNFAKTPPAEVSVKGDLIPADGRSGWKAETLLASKVEVEGDVDGSASPVILVGDSHAQIFSVGGEMLMNDAGVVDHLQADLGFPVVVESNRGSALQAHVRGLYKDAAFWEGRKAVVWLTTARALTRERKWRSLPRLPR